MYLLLLFSTSFKYPFFFLFCNFPYDSSHRCKDFKQLSFCLFILTSILFLSGYAPFSSWASSFFAVILWISFAFFLEWSHFFLDLFFFHLSWFPPLIWWSTSSHIFVRWQRWYSGKEHADDSFKHACLLSLVWTACFYA